MERRIQIAEEQGNQQVPLIDHPAGIPADWEDHVKLMFDLQVLAYQTDLTRVITMMLGHEQSGMTYPQIGVPDAHHPISHHQQEPEKVAKVAKINAYHVKMFAYLLEKLRATPDGDGTLLDHMTLIYGAGIADSNTHAPVNIPVHFGGRRRGQSQGRTPHPLQGYAAGEPPPDAAGSVGRAHRIRSATAREGSIRRRFA